MKNSYSRNQIPNCSRKKFNKNKENNNRKHIKHLDLKLKQKKLYMDGLLEPEFDENYKIYTLNPRIDENNTLYIDLENTYVTFSGESFNEIMDKMANLQLSLTF